MALMTKEQNGVMQAMCPHCSKNYAMTDNKGNQNDIPSKCRRCDCPMTDSRAATKFMDEQAEAEANPAVTELGERFRGKRREKREKVTA